eukprot:TRINITY_DN864_c0_g1_i1.p1 TRINITY_DN864_c0_g1~~TRINITY_DN864_c0_g1_i1.p1  ORF type:complete len:400 (+),score=142.16 TRINITY_DN864_c0_g1_i1:103-1302(+)
MRMAFVHSCSTALWRRRGGGGGGGGGARKRCARFTGSASERGSSSSSSSSALPRGAQLVRDELERVLSASLQQFEERSALLSGAWRSVGNNWMLRPDARTPPVAVVHFVGGALFGAAPHVCYDALLHSLAKRGMVVVATAYDLSFDHVRAAEQVAREWERVESQLATEFGALPVVGVAHSLGCVIATLAQCLFDGSCERSANVFISFCCRDADAAVPLSARTLRDAARALQRVQQQPYAQQLRACCEQRWHALLRSAATPPSLRRVVAPAAQQSARLLTQLRHVLRECAELRDGQSLAFRPRARDVLAVAHTLYDVERTLLLSFERDALDDGAEVEAALRRGASNEVTRRVTRNGAHLTPLALSVIGEPRLDALALRDVRALGASLSAWLHQHVASRAP